jgi:hypothetical protein
MGWDDPNADPLADMANALRWAEEDYDAMLAGRERPPYPAPAYREPVEEAPDPADSRSAGSGPEMN